MSSKDEVAMRLASAHYQIEEGITQIFRVTGRGDAETGTDEPIKLLEVNRYTVPAGIMPLYFGAVPTSGIPYPSIIVEVTPDEFQQIQANQLKLPDGWAVGDLLPNGT